MKNIKKRMLPVFVLMLVMVFVFGSVNVYAATVGDQLTAPEVGWKRFNSNDSRITYIGHWGNSSYSMYYEGNARYTVNAYDSNNPDSIGIKFKGTKIRIISQVNNVLCNNVSVEVDGIMREPMSLYYSDIPTTAGGQTIAYEVTGLSNDIHVVKLTRASTGSFNLDAIDIDADGELLGYNQQMYLQATPGDSQVALLWNVVTDATSYTVKRATTAGGPYTIITSNVTTTSYTDTTVTNGTTYYYVVTATVSGTESANSNEASATPQTTTPTPPQTGSAILVIKMVDGTQKEYDLSMTEVNNFINWYNTKDNGTGNPYYTIEKTWNKGPFNSRKDYLIFDKICFFEINGY